MSMTMMIAKIDESTDFSDPLFSNPPELGKPSELRRKVIEKVGKDVRIERRDSIEIHFDSFAVTLWFNSNRIDLEVAGGADERIEYLDKLAKHLDPEANLIFCDG